MRFALCLWLVAATHASELGQASRACDVSVVQRLIASGVPLSEPDSRFNTPLHEAMAAGKAPCVYLLLKAGANPYPPNRAGETPHLLARRYPDAAVRAELLGLIENPGLFQPASDSLGFAVLRGLEPVVRAILDAGADPNAVDATGRTALHQAALKGRPEIIRVLLDHGADIEAEDRDGSRPLHDAALGGDIASVGVLIAHGADLKAVTANGETALHIAASWGKSGVVRELLEAGANKNARNRRGETARDLALKNGQTDTAAMLR